MQLNLFMSECEPGYHENEHREIMNECGCCESEPGEFIFYAV